MRARHHTMMKFAQLPCFLCAAVAAVVIVVFVGGGGGGDSGGGARIVSYRIALWSFSKCLNFQLPLLPLNLDSIYF